MVLTNTSNIIPVSLCTIHDAHIKKQTGFSSVVEPLPCKPKTLGSILRSEGKEKNKETDSLHTEASSELSLPAPRQVSNKPRIYVTIYKGFIFTGR